MIKIKVNGKDMEIEEGTTVDLLLKRLEIRPLGTAVEINRKIVPKAKHKETFLNEGDRVEIVHFVGGG